MLAIAACSIASGSYAAQKAETKDLIRLMNASRGLDFAKRCNKAVGGEDESIAFFQGVVAEQEKKVGKFEPKLAKLFGHLQAESIARVERKHLKAYCFERLHEIRSEVS